MQDIFHQKPVLTQTPGLLKLNSFTVSPLSLSSCPSLDGRLTSSFSIFFSSRKKCNHCFHYQGFLSLCFCSIVTKSTTNSFHFMAASHLHQLHSRSIASAFAAFLENSPMTSGPSVLSGIRPVTHLYLSEVTSDSVSVAWSAPAPPADLFILSFSSADGTDSSKLTLEGAKTRLMVEGLLPSTQYTISLITIQGDITSEPITASLTTGETLDFLEI